MTNWGVQGDILDFRTHTGRGRINAKEGRGRNFGWTMIRLSISASEPGI